MATCYRQTTAYQTNLARQTRSLVGVYFPNTLQIRLVLDNLNIHIASTLHETWGAIEACLIRRRLVFTLYFMPVGSIGLNWELPFSLANALIGTIKLSLIYATKLVFGNLSAMPTKPVCTDVSRAKRRVSIYVCLIHLVVYSSI